MMQTYLAVFRSRSQTLDFVARLRSFGIPASAVSTPKEANVGCGLSAKIGAFDLSRAKRALAGGWEAAARRRLSLWRRSPGEAKKTQRGWHVPAGSLPMDTAPEQ